MSRTPICSLESARRKNFHELDVHHADVRRNLDARRNRREGNFS